MSNVLTFFAFSPDFFPPFEIGLTAFCPSRFFGGGKVRETPLEGAARGGGGGGGELSLIHI